MHDEVLNEELHHALRIDSGVPLIRSHLHLKILACALQGLNQLHGIVLMHVVVCRAVIDEQPSAQIPA